MFEFKLPDIGEGVTEGEIVKWLVNKGDDVSEDQPIVEIMTDKATVEIASPRSGKIMEVNGAEGDVIPVGSVLVKIEESGNGQVVSIASKERKEPEKDLGLFTASPAPERPATRSAQPAAAVATFPGTSKTLASPATRKLARELGIDLTAVRGTGPNGRVTKQDLTGAPTTGSAAPALRPRPTRPSGGEERIPLRGIRKRISEHLVHSKHTAPHFTQFEEVDFTELVTVRKKAKELMEGTGVKITYLPFIVKALCKTLLDFPYMNASLDDEKSEIVLKHYFNIGIAVAGPDGLVVPNIKNADQKTIVEIAAEIQMLADKARAGKLALDEIQGGTFTITSTGGSGGFMASPIINHPEVAILGINRIRKAPVVRDGAITIRDMGHISLSLDHRVVDGAVSAAFIHKFVKFLETPSLLLLDA